MGRYNNFTESDLIRCFSVLKIYKELTANEWAERLGIKDLYLFSHLRRKVMEYFNENIQVIGQRRGTRYRYVDSLKEKNYDLKKIKNEKALKKKESSNGTIIGTWEEIKKLIEDLGCNFNGKCNLIKLNPLYCAGCSHQVRIPIPETVKSNRTISKLESKLKKLKIKGVS